MKKYVNGEYIDITPEEIAKSLAEAEAFERDYWKSIDYDDAVNTKIREKYTESQEFALLRQRDEKPLEYSEYYEYCEACKAFVKEKKAQV